MTVRLTVQGTGRVLDFDPAEVVIAGFTGRDQAAVRAHVEELAREGISAPAELPAFYTVPPGHLSVSDEISVDEPETSGEAEPVLIVYQDAWYLGLGSDHTARSLERESIELAKRACPKVLAPEVWEYETVRAAWDRLELASWTDRDAHLVPYQQSAVSGILPVDAILPAFGRWGGALGAGTVMFLGTVPLLTGGFVFGRRFVAELRDPAAGRFLRLEYGVSRRSNV